MKATIYTILLLMTISGDLVHLAYALSIEHEDIELIYENKGENESEENKEIGEDASEIPSSQIHFGFSINSKIQKLAKSLSLNDEQFSRVATPPPDYI